MTWGFATTTDDLLAGVDLHDTVTIVTGGTSGLGFETARALATAGAHVVLPARDAGRGDAAVATLTDAVAGARIEPAVLDLTSLASVVSFASSFSERFDRCDLLINNAGVMATPFERTTDGFELQLGTNHLGHFALTRLLLPQLLAAAPARVVNLTSAGHFASDIVWDDPNYERRPYDKWEAYGQSKTANILFSVGLEERFGASGLHAYAVHPGMVPTDLGRHMSAEDMNDLVARASGDLPAMKTIPQGAATTVFAAVAPELETRGGTYLADCAVSDEHAPWALDPAGAERCWALSESLVD